MITKNYQSVLLFIFILAGLQENVLSSSVCNRCKKPIDRKVTNELYRTIDGKRYTEYRQAKKKVEDINKKSNLQTILLYNHINNSRPFIVLNKKREELTLYNSKNEFLATNLIRPSHSLEDDKRSDFEMGEERGGGAGIYDLLAIEDFFIKLRDQRGRISELELVNQDTQCKSFICSNLGYTLPELMEQHNITPPISLYILPNNEKLEFIFKNNMLTFTTFQKDLAYYKYNFSPRQQKAIPTKFSIENPKYDNEYARIFLKALEDQKQTLMDLYQLHNDEYNELVIIAFGILGQESRFATSLKYRIKERFPQGIAFAKNYRNIFHDYDQIRKTKGTKTAIGYLLKSLGQNTKEFFTGKISIDDNSRGPTQIKRVPSLIKEYYHINKEDLHKPKFAAIATLGFLAQSIEELKAKEIYHPNITGRNRLEYLHYIYMGLSYEITEGTATPEKNIYFRNIRKFSESLRIWQQL